MSREHEESRSYHAMIKKLTTAGIIGAVVLTIGIILAVVLF